MQSLIAELSILRNFSGDPKSTKMQSKNLMNSLVNFSESSDNYKDTSEWLGNFTFHWLLMRLLKFSGKSVRTQINASIATYLSFCYLHGFFT